VHSGSGLDFQAPTLNSIRLQNKWHNPKVAVSAMIMTKSYLEKLECYACHFTWVPQCYGCHVKVDYSEGKKYAVFA